MEGLSAVGRDIGSPICGKTHDLLGNRRRVSADGTHRRPGPGRARENKRVRGRAGENGKCTGPATWVSVNDWIRPDARQAYLMQVLSHERPESGLLRWDVRIERGGVELARLRRRDGEKDRGSRSVDREMEGRAGADRTRKTRNVN